MFGQINSMSKTAWGQISEENFIKYDLPMYVHVNKLSFRQHLEGYLQGLPLRKKWWRGSHDAERLAYLARMVLIDPPVIWHESNGEGKEWFIQYEGEPKPKKYYFR